MSQTYRTRHLTARESALVDALARYPRYAPLVAKLRPDPEPKPAPKRKADDEHERQVEKPKPKAR
jgi:hypothetical protein